MTISDTTLRSVYVKPYSGPSELLILALTLAQIPYSAKSEIFVFPETSDKFSRSHAI